MRHFDFFGGDAYVFDYYMYIFPVPYIHLIKTCILYQLDFHFLL